MHNRHRPQLTIDQICNPSSAKNEGATGEDSTPKWTFTIHKLVASSHSSRYKALFFLGELGSIYTRQDRLTEARGLYDQILKLQPDTEHVALN
ncbi:MAG: tetratricopeptide repeat protein [Pseudomonadota bacterium]